jgi:hypothetical protein
LRPFSGGSGEDCSDYDGKGSMMWSREPVGGLRAMADRS